MSHPQQLEFVNSVKNQFENYFSNSSVLEIGSLDINGSVRQFFNDCRYVGIDVGEGPGVDIICEGQKFNDPDSSYDVVISCECFEHNPYWAETFSNMIRLCKSDGLIIFTCATTGRKEHGTSRTSPADSPLTIGIGWDYYKNLTEDDFKSKMNFENFFQNYNFSTNPSSKDLYFYGIKK